MSQNLVDNLSLASVVPQAARPATTRTLNAVATFAKTLQNLAHQEPGPQAGPQSAPPQQTKRPDPVQQRPEARPAAQKVSDRPAERPEQPARKPETPVAKGKAEKGKDKVPVEQGAVVVKPEGPKGEGRPAEPPRAQVTLPANAKGHTDRLEVEAEGDEEAVLPLTELVAELAATVVLPPQPELAQTVGLVQQVDTLVTDVPLVATEGAVSLEELVPIAEPAGEGDVPVLVPVADPFQEDEAPTELVTLVEDTVVVAAPVAEAELPALVPAFQVEAGEATEEREETPAVLAVAPLEIAETQEPEPVAEVPQDAPELVSEAGSVPLVKAAFAPVADTPPPVTLDDDEPVRAVPGEKPETAPPTAVADVKEVVTQAQAQRPAAGEGHRGIGETVSEFARTKSIEHLLKPLRGEMVVDRGGQLQRGPDHLPAQATADPLQALVEQGKPVLFTVKPEKAADSSPVQAMVETLAKVGDLAEQEQGLEIPVEGADDAQAVAVQVGADDAEGNPSGQDQAKFQMASAKEITTHMKIGNDSKVTAYSDRDVIQQVIERIKQAANAGKSEVRLRLNPESLGEVHVRIISHQGQVTVRLLTDNPEVQKLVESGMGHLRSALADQGVKVNQVHVTHAQEDRHPGQDQQQGQEQPKEERREKRQERDGVALNDFASMLAREG